MRTETLKLLSGIFPAPPDQAPWEWARDNVDFSLVPSYDTPLHGPYDPDYMPYWKEVVEVAFDPSVAETTILKCSRAGGSENVILNRMRYNVAVKPERSLYVSGQQKAVEDFTAGRIKLGMNASVVTAKKYRKAQSVEHKIAFDDMLLAVAWPRDKMAFKQSGWEVIYVDEFSVYPELTPVMIRKRCDTYNFSHIIWLSSPDPQQKRASKDDPIFIEFARTDRRYWQMPDPVTGNMFRFEMGGPECKWGLKWDSTAELEKGIWDWEKVRESAYYLTPDGTRIDNAGKQALVAKGKWVSTNPDAPKKLRGYHLNAFYLPFSSGDFGNIAVEFLKAKAGGPQQLRVFVYEYLAEEWKDEIEATDDQKIYSRQGQYDKGEKHSTVQIYKDIYLKKDSCVFVTVDMQKGHHWQLAREWIRGGDSGLVDWGYGADFNALTDFANKVDAHKIYIDNGYAKRSWEVLQYCLYEGGSFPTIGSETLGIPFRKNVIDPLEGKSGAGENEMVGYTFRTDTFKSLLMDMVNGSSVTQWHIYHQIERDYVRQVCSEERISGKWEVKRGHSENHLWDCEVLQLLAATIEQFYESEWMG